MILVIHVTIATISVLSSLFTILLPTHFKLRVTQILTIATLASGIAMFIIHPVNIKQSCLNGILYLGFIAFASTVSNHRLAAIKKKASL